MGTNFYWTKNKHTAEYHIGKRSAAGPYCFDCGVSLCMGGESQVHMGLSGWNDKCPKCGQSPIKESIDEGSVGVELGFAEPKTKKPKGVRGCSSFTWGLHRQDVLDSKRRYVWDEYGKRMTKAEFLRMLEANCPIQSYNMIGRDFC